MSCTKKYCFIIFGFILLPSNITGLRDLVASGLFILTGDGNAAETSADLNHADIEMDYFFGERTLRTNDNMVCKSDELKHECSMMCGTNNFGCIFEDCICLDGDLKKGKMKKEENLPPSEKEIKTMLHKFENLIEVLRRYSNKGPDEFEITERPALRHHIAHFCPNLAVARQCIRTCMQLGKPAFCGKDHNCYCGHKYDQHSEDANVDIEDTYAKYRDLYTKYFGAEGGKPINIYGK